MKISAGKRYKRSHRTLNAIFINNPALVLGFDLPFLIATSTSLKNAAAMAIEIAAIHLVTMMFCVVFGRKLKPWVRAAITVVVSTGMMVLTRELILMIFTDISNSLGMYIYLMAVNGLTLFESLSLTPRSRIMPVIKKEFFHILAFIFTMLFVSLFREYFGNSTIWGIPAPAPFKLGGLLIPFSGFILLGFLMAFMRFFNHKLIGFAVTEASRRENSYIIRPR